MRPLHIAIVILGLVVTPSLAQWLVGVSGTEKGNAGGRLCTFPFLYQGISYNECITTDNKFIPWCSMTSNYDSFNQWANCKVTIAANRTRNGNAGKSSCTFPFVYKGRIYNECTTDDYYSNKPWCATSPNYQRDKQWGECVRYPDIKTTGGNVPVGTQCNFPFDYRGTRYHGCTTENNQGVGWCSATPDYGNEALWGNCVVTITNNDNNNNNNCPNGNTYSGPAVNTNSFGGTGVATSGNNPNDPSPCQFECDKQGSCVGFDWDRNPGLTIRCFLHTLGSFAQKEPSSDVDQYTVTNRCTTNPGGNNGGTSGVVTTRGGNAGRSNQCSFPFNYRRKSYVSCTSARWYTPWCAVTSDYDRDKRWGECNNIPTM